MQKNTPKMKRCNYAPNIKRRKKLITNQKHKGKATTQSGSISDGSGNLVPNSTFSKQGHPAHLSSSALDRGVVNCGRITAWVLLSREQTWPLDSKGQSRARTGPCQDWRCSSQQLTGEGQPSRDSRKEKQTIKGRENRRGRRSAESECSEGRGKKDQRGEENDMDRKSDKESKKREQQKMEAGRKENNW